MSKYTKEEKNIYFLNDKNIALDLNDNIILLNPIVALSLLLKSYNELSTYSEDLCDGTYNSAINKAIEFDKILSSNIVNFVNEKYDPNIQVILSDINAILEYVKSLSSTDLTNLGQIPTLSIKLDKLGMNNSKIVKFIGHMYLDSSDLSQPSSLTSLLDYKGFLEDGVILNGSMINVVFEDELSSKYTTTDGIVISDKDVIQIHKHVSDIEIKAEDLNASDVIVLHNAISRNEFEQFKVDIDNKHYLVSNDLSIAFQGESTGKWYAVLLSTDNNAYVNVPWTDVAIESAWYDQTTHYIFIEFNDKAKDIISVNISGLVDIYTAGEGLKLENNKFSVSAAYALSNDVSSKIELSEEFKKYQLSGDYALSSDVSSKEDLEAEFKKYLLSGNYALSNDVSSKAELEAEFKKYQLSGNYALSNDVSSKAELEAEFKKYQLSGNYALSNDIPTKISQLNNDVGFLSSHLSLSDYYNKEEIDEKLTSVVGSISSVNNLTPINGNITLFIPLSASLIINDANYLSAIPAEYKTYADIISVLSNDGYALVSDISTTFEKISNDISSLSIILNNEILSSIDISSKILKISTIINDLSSDLSIAISSNTISINNKSSIFITDPDFNEISNKSDLNIVKLTRNEYYELVATSAILSNTLYVVSSENINAYDRTITNVAEPLLSNDAATKNYVDAEVGKINVPTKVTQLSNDANFISAVPLASTDKIGGIKVGFESGNHNYAVQLSNEIAYVNVPWTDVAIESAWYNTDTKNIIIKFNDKSKDLISVNVSDLVDTYTAGEGLKLENNKFSVSAAYALSNDVSSKAELEAEFKKYLLSGDYAKISDLTILSEKLSTKSSIFITDPDNNELSNRTNLNIIKISYDKYAELVLTSSILSDTLYVVSSENINAYNRTITNVAEPLLSNDAATKNYVDKLSDEYQAKGNYLTSHLSLSNYYTKSLTSSANEISIAIKNIDMSAYALSSDVSSKTELEAEFAKKTATYIIDPDVSEEAILTDLIVQKISDKDYYNLVVTSSIISNTLYVVSSDSIDAYNENITNVAEPLLSNDAATKNYVDKKTIISAATSNILGGIKIGFNSNNHNYAVLLSNDMAYVNVPWTDVAISSVRYDSTTKQIILIFNDETKTALSVNVSDLVDTYTAGEGLKLENNKFSVSATYALSSDVSSKAELEAEFKKYQLSGNYALSNDVSSKTELETEFAKKSTTYVFDPDISEQSVLTDLIVKKIAADDYYELVATSSTISNTLYVISSENINAYDMRIEYVADPISATDAATKKYVDEHILEISSISSALSTVFLLSGNYALSNDVSSKTELEAEFAKKTATYIIDPDVSEEAILTDLIVQKISLEDYDELIYLSATLSNTLYVVSSDSINVYNERIINVADPISATDVVTLQYADSHYLSANAIDQLDGIILKDQKEGLDAKYKICIYNGSLSISQI